MWVRLEYYAVIIQKTIMAPKKKANKKSVKRSKLPQEEHQVSHPPYEKMTSDAFQNLKQSANFSREDILKYICTHYRIPNKKMAMNKINAVLKDCVNNGTLERVSGTGIKGKFRLVEKTTKKNPQKTRLKTVCSSKKRSSRVDVTESNEKASVKDTEIDSKKRYDLRKKPSKEITTETPIVRNSKVIETKRRKGTTRKNVEQTLEAKHSLKVSSNTDIPDTKLTASQPVSIETRVFSSAKESGFSHKVVELKSKRTALFDYEPEPDDVDICGIVVLKDGRRILASQTSMMLFSPVMKRLAILKLSEKPVPQANGITLSRDVIMDIAIFSDNEAIALMRSLGSKIQFVEISSESLLLSESLKTKCIAVGVTACRGFIYLTKIDNPPGIRKIDRSGKNYWLISTTELNRPIFNFPNAIESFVEGDSIKLIVTDTGLSYLSVSLLDGESGKILCYRAENKVTQGVTVDHFHNIYICYWSDKSVSMLTSDVLDERIILSTEGKRTTYTDALAYDFEEYPRQLAFDPLSNSLLVTSWNNHNRFPNHIHIYEFGFE